MRPVRGSRKAQGAGVVRPATLWRSRESLKGTLGAIGREKIYGWTRLGRAEGNGAEATRSRFLYQPPL
jgi:hypothetical protein